MSLNRFKLTAFEAETIESNWDGEYLTMSTMFVAGPQIQVNDGSLFRETCKSALWKLQRRHPFLRSHLGFGPGSKEMCLIVSDPDENDVKEQLQVEFVDLTNETSSPNRDALCKLSAEFNTRLFDLKNPNKLLWRVQIISYKQAQENNLNDEKQNDSSTMIHIVNIVTVIPIVDGLSITCLSAEFVNVFNSLSTGSSCREMTEILEPCPSMIDLFRASRQFNEEHRHRAAEFKKRTGFFPIHEKFESPEERGFFLDFFKLDASTTRQLMQTCKSYQVRITAFAYTAVLYAFNKLYQENGLKIPDLLNIEFPINMRMRIEPKVNVCSGRFMILFGEATLDRAKFGTFADFWTDCSYVQTVVDKCSNTENGAAFADIYLSEELSGPRDNNDDDDEDKEHDHSETFVSNLGKFVSDSVEMVDGPLVLQEIYCSDSLQVVPHYGKKTQFHVTYWKDEIMMQFGANKHFFGTEFCRRLVSLYKATILENI